MKSLLRLCLVSALIAGSNATVFSQEVPLPKWLTEEEEAILPTYTVPDVSHMATPLSGARSQNFRTMAEWEELQSVVITWTGFQAVLAEIVREIKNEVEVIIVCSNPASVQNYLNGKGVDFSSNVTFLQAPFNTIWVRDYGPNTVYKNDVDSLYLVDWIYNRPRPSDDIVPFTVGNYLDLPVLATSEAPDDLVHTGGNFMSDGMGLGFSSNLVLDENGPGNKYGTSNHDEAAVDDIMQRFMGIEPYAKMTNLPFDGIHHIDMHMKLLDEQTLLVGQYPMGIADGPQIEANIQYVLNNYNTNRGTPFKVIRMPMPPDALNRYPHQGGHYRTYTNSLVANKTIIVPIYEEKYDTTALRIYREAKPGYRVVGIDCNAIIPSGGALHCITKEVGVHDPLRIVHWPVDGSVTNMDGIPVEVLLQHRSGIQSATLFYATDTLLGYQSTEMTPGTETDIWEATLPFLEKDADVFYYIEAVAESGKVQRRPMTAPAGYWNFVMPEGGTSSNDIQLSQPITMSVFPNPAKAITCIPVEFDQYQGGVRLELVDALGKSWLLADEQVNGGSKKYFFHANTYPSGIYQIRLITLAGAQTQTVVISR